MTWRVAIALVRRGGVALLAAASLGWWAFHIDTVTRAERAEERKAFISALEECMRGRARVAKAIKED